MERSADNRKVLGSNPSGPIFTTLQEEIFINPNPFLNRVRRETRFKVLKGGVGTYKISISDSDGSIGINVNLKEGKIDIAYRRRNEEGSEIFQNVGLDLRGGFTLESFEYMPSLENEIRRDEVIPEKGASRNLETQVLTSLEKEQKEFKLTPSKRAYLEIIEDLVKESNILRWEDIWKKFRGNEHKGTRIWVIRTLNELATSGIVERIENESEVIYKVRVEKLRSLLSKPGYESPKVENSINFGQKLRQLRIQKGLTQRQLAKELGYKTNSYISDIERGRIIPPRGKLKKIAEILGIPFEVLDDMAFQARVRRIRQT